MSIHIFCLLRCVLATYGLRFNRLGIINTILNHEHLHLKNDIMQELFKKLIERRNGSLNIIFQLCLSKDQSISPKNRVGEANCIEIYFELSRI